MLLIARWNNATSLEASDSATPRKRSVQQRLIICKKSVTVWSHVDFDFDYLGFLDFDTLDKDMGLL